ncbi:MAG: CcoQ/FixQ family Cbb3-type cytochrome c oxidase assembly chaperone [Planctomycetes bacterium]|nr:CcoQ/FixQ family Cbb3-type cytochrome c oxidase assembly chaperone [Planctomycetota bacterium]
MWKDLFSSADFMSLPLVTLFLFIGVFVGVACWTFSKKRKSHYDVMAQMPLEGRAHGGFDSQRDTNTDTTKEELR